MPAATCQKCRGVGYLTAPLTHEAERQVRKSAKPILTKIPTPRPSSVPRQRWAARTRLGTGRPGQRAAMVCSSRPDNGAGDGFRGEVRTAFKLPGQVPDRCRLCRGAIRACYWEVEIKRKGASSALGKKRLFDSVGPGALGMGESTILGTDCRKTQPNNARSCTARRSRGTNSGCQTVSPIALISWTSRSIALALASAIGRHAQAIEVLSASFAYRKKHPRCRSGADIAIPSGT